MSIPSGATTGGLEVVDLADPAMLADPYRGFGRLREQGPVEQVRMPDGTVVHVVTRQDDVRAVLADHGVVTDPTAIAGVEDLRLRVLRQIGVPDDLVGYLTHSVIDLDGVDHTRVRRLVSRAFTVRRVTELRPRVEQLTNGLLDRLTDGADLLERFSYPLPITEICEMVGVPEADRPDWRRWADALISMQPGRIGPAMAEMIAHCHDLAARRRADPQPDLLSALVTARDEDRGALTETEIVTMLLTLVFAGHETTAHLISNGALALMQHPDQLEHLRRDPDLWPGAVHELMRWCSPVLINRVRYLAEDRTVGGVDLRAGAAVLPVLVAANRDPRVYSDPERLDVTRQLAGHGDGHVGFGHGAHYCLGAALARQEGEVALHALFTRFPGLRPATDTPQWSPLPGSRRLLSLPVHLG